MKKLLYTPRKGHNIWLFIPALLVSVLFFTPAFSQYQMEKLNRGVTAIRTGNNNFVSWRWLGTEDDITFNLYRNGTKVNANPLTVTNYTDNGAASNASYYVRTVVGGVEQPQSETVTPWAQNYLNIPLQTPANGTTPSGETYSYNANDASVADLDGDGVYEVILKWDPSNSKDNSQSGYTGPTYVDAYKLNGTLMWRINFGINIRSGAHYMDFMVYDFDGDGKAEMMARTADGTTDAKGTRIGTTADYRSSAGYILTGPEYLSIFNGQTGAVMATGDYWPARGTVSSWGDSYGNRVDRFRAGVAYLDGKKASGIFCRGYYTRMTVAAWDWNGTALTRRWTFDSGSSGAYYGQGDHSLSIADVDGDGKQEVISGSAIIDDNGSGYYSTQYGHGDALHVSDLDPDIDGLEVFNIQEYGVPLQDAYMYNAKSKRVLWTNGQNTTAEGPGRAVSADITAKFKGAECWIAGGATTGGPWTCKGASMGMAQPVSMNFLAWWDGDLLRELLNGTQIDKYEGGRLLTATGCSSNNSSKSTPNLSGDFFGDWREEVMWRTSDNKNLRIYSTTIPTTYKIRTLMHDPQYRVAIAWQNTGYNQPPHVSFFLGDGMATPPKPNITIIGGSQTNAAPTISITAPANNATFTAPATVTISANASDSDGSVAKVDFYNGATLIGTDNTSPFIYSWTNVAVGTYTITAKATDDDGSSTTSSAITITVTSPNTPPTVSITSPINNTIINGAPATITINATAADANGTVSKVDFYNGSTLLGSDNNSPYTFSWIDVAAGTYTLTAVATDNGNATSTSNSVVISIVELPTDCNGVSGGSATTDVCGRCVGGSTGKTTCTLVTEAEKACAFDGIQEDLNEGYNDSGYVNVPNQVGASITFVINAQNAGNATISFRYANGSTTNRTAQLTVNNILVPGTIAFGATGAWNDWDVIDVSVTLVKGANTIILAATTATGLANIDQIGLVSTGLSVGQCGPITGTSYDDLGESTSFSLYPNPSASNFTLILSESADVKVMDAKGVMLNAGKQLNYFQFGEEYIAGVYFVHIASNGTSKVLRVIKK